MSHRLSELTAIVRPQFWHIWTHNLLRLFCVLVTRRHEVFKVGGDWRMTS